MRTSFLCLRTNLFHDANPQGFDIQDRFDETLDKQFVGYRALLMTYFHINSGPNLRTGTSLGTLLHFANLNRERGMRLKPKYILLLDCLMWMIERRYITVRHKGQSITKPQQFDGVKFHDLIDVLICEEEFYPLSMGDDEYEYKYSEPFTIVTEREFNTLTSDITNSSLKQFLAYLIAKHMIGWRTDKYQTITSHPKAAVITQEHLAAKLDCAHTSAGRYLQFFIDKGLLVKRPMYICSTATRKLFIYALNEPGWEDEINYGIAKFRKGVSE